MAKTIWKFPLGLYDSQIIKLPRNAQILTVQLQNNVPCLWALVDPSRKTDDHTIEIICTGHEIQEANRKYIGTYQLRNGELVYHVFELNL